jgi:glycosyltransferase involved in cell wall biosynthesis
VINCSKRSAEFHERIGYSSERTIVVPNGYDPGTYFPDEKRRSAMREALGIGNGIFVVGAIARWSTRKDLPNLLRAFALLARMRTKIVCLLIGRDLDQVNAELMGYVSQLRLSDRIIPLGYRSDLPDVARAIDLHVLPSATEAFPNAVAESMLCATPNVVTDVGDAALMVGESGWIVEPRNYKALAEGMEAAYLEWKDKPELWLKRREAARSRIADRFTFDSMARAYEEIWTKAAESTHSSLDH